MKRPTLSYGPKAKVALIVEIPTPYRNPQFQYFLERSDLDLDIFFLSEKQKDRPWNLEKIENNHVTYLRSHQFCIQGEHTFHLNFWSEHLFKRKYDVMVIGGYGQWLMLRAILHAQKTNTPYVLITESHLLKSRSSFKNAIKDRLLKRIYGRSSANLVMGTLSKEYVCHYGAKAESVKLFPNAVDFDDFVRGLESVRSEIRLLREELNPDKRKIILFVGALSKRKGTDLLFAAIEKVVSQYKACLWLVGQEQDVYVSNVSASIKPYIHHFGYIQPKDLPRYYGAADIFVLPSIQEPYGAVLCEAMMAGLWPVVSDQVGAAEDCIRSGETGLICKAGDSNELATALISSLALLDSPGFSKQKIQRSLSYLTKKHAYEQFTGAIRLALDQ